MNRKKEAGEAMEFYWFVKSWFESRSVNEAAESIPKWLDQTNRTLIGFVRVWNTSKDIKEVCSRLEMSKQKATKTAYNLLKHGVSLKIHGMGLPPQKRRKK